MTNSNIPLVRSNSVNDINTSIIAIKKELKTNGETDINVNVDVNYPENAYPVDAVTDGDMHAVTSNAVFDALENNTQTDTYNLITASSGIKSLLNTQTYPFQFFITKTGKNSYHLRLNSVSIECKDSGQSSAYVGLFDYSNALSQLFGETRNIRSIYGSTGLFINHSDGTISMCNIYTGGGDGKSILIQYCANHNSTAYPKDGIIFSLIGDIDIYM